MALVLQLVGVGVIGCSDSSSSPPPPETKPTTPDPATAKPTTPTTPEVDTTSSIPFTLPGGSSAVVNALYSGFDGVHDYQVPLTSLVPNVKFSVEDESLAELRKTEVGVMIKTKKAGTTNIVGKAGNLVGKIPLTITTFTPEDWNTGNKRYNNKTGAFKTILPCEYSEEETGIEPKASCSECHRKATWGAVIQHSPTQAAGYSDQELTLVFTQAKKPAGWKQHIPDLGPAWRRFHKWSMSPDEARGIISFLRALEPTDMADFTDQPPEEPPVEEDQEVEVKPESDPFIYECLETDGGIRVERFDDYLDAGTEPEVDSSL